MEVRLHSDAAAALATDVEMRVLKSWIDREAYQEERIQRWMDCVGR
jgi:hypothetical protein